MKCSLFNTITLVCLSACLFGWVEAQRRLCGRNLADMLDLVCAGRGFHLGKRAGRNSGIVLSRPDQPSMGADSVNDKNPPIPSANGTVAVNVRQIAADSKLGRFLESIVNRDVSTAHSSSSDTQTNDQHNNNAIEERLHRLRRRDSTSSIVEECCYQACTFATLNSYCAASNSTDEELSLEQLRIRLGYTVPVGASPSPSSAAVALTQRPTILARPTAQIIRGNRRRHHPFFYVSIGNQPTRSPLLEK